MSKTFCILPWKHLTFFPDGAPLLCCKASDPVTDTEGKPMSLYTHSLDEIWNSDEMRHIRQDMLEGRKVPRCEICYQQEEAGNISYRVASNRNWGRGWLNDEQWKLPQLKNSSVANDHRVPAPAFLELSVGNLCNLKCRMCGGGASSRIARDPVHSPWSPGGQDLLSQEQHWWQIDAITRDLLSHPEQLRQLYLLGGEPLIIKEVGQYLQQLIDAGVAHNVTLMLSTNGTTTSAPWLKLIEAFCALNMVVSIDGFGPYYEYIRYPAKWLPVAANLAVFQQLPKTVVTAGVTFQAYNALNIVELLRFLDSQNIPYQFYSIDYPTQLRTLVLPPRARRLAAQRLRDYAEQDCLPAHQEVVRSHAKALEAMGDAFDAHWMREFMVFTNDLDVTRGQGFRETHAELLELIEETGFVWTDETRHAARRSLPLAAV